MRANSHRQHGFSLVEVLVAMVIALLGTIIIFQVFAVSEGIRRTSTSGGDAQQNGLLALISIERSTRLAGFGINYAPLLGCIVQGHDEGPPIRDFSFRMVAAQIADGGGTAPDSITLAYGNNEMLRAPSQLQFAVTAPGTVFNVDNRLGFNLGELVIIADQGSATNCTMRQVTALPTTSTGDIGNDSGNYQDANNNTQVARYNKSGGVGLAYNAWNKVTSGGGRVLSMGPAPSVLVYSIVNSQLMLQSFVSSGSQVPVADGIVQLQILYGKDTNNDGNVDLWESTMPVNPTSAQWAQILALRIALVARSGLSEKPQVQGGPCDTTTVAAGNVPTWTGPAGTPVQFDLTADPNWQCYRYRSFETVVPLRNNLWAQS